MIIKTVIKCDVDKAPYRVYINDELITERLYAQAPTNTLQVELVDRDKYHVRVDSLDTSIKIFSKTETINALA